MDLEALAPEACEPAALQHADARDLAQQLARTSLPYARLLECRRGDVFEVVVFETDVELAQHLVHDIRSVEPVAVVFTLPADAAHAPEVLALRTDFPGTVLHVNLRDWEFPKSLCLYDVHFRDLRAQWTPARFVARIREWFRLTARGELHAADQPLELFLGDAKGWIVLPHAIQTDRTMMAGVVADAGTGAGAASSLSIAFHRLPDHHGMPVLVGSLPRATPDPASVNTVAAIVRTQPRVHAAIRRTPATLHDLHNMLAEGGGDLLGALRASLRNWPRSRPVLDAPFVLVVFVPKVRESGGTVEEIETLAILTDKTVREVGTAIGVWDVENGEVGILISPDLSRTGTTVPLVLAHPVFTLSRTGAAQLSGRDAASGMCIVAVGGGSLGSQVFLNAVRAAFGTWVIIDDDLYLPHNPVRHPLPTAAIGYPKALTLAAMANELAPDRPVAIGIVADVLEPGDEAEAVAAALASADVIVDTSASVTVARALARDVPASARRVSLFLNPTGTDLTMLAEDGARAMPLDALEMQYYRALVHHPGMQGALQPGVAKVRYGRSCRDVSVRLPQALVGLHAGIATQGLEQALASPDARLRNWHVDRETFAVTAIDIPPAPVRTCNLGDWTLVTDDHLLGRLSEIRAGKLPNETGGVLLGTFDLTRRIVYVVDTIPSPPDSKEWPTLYIRGCSGLEDDVRRVEEATAGQLHYIGEWHSHPAGCACLPSDDDLKVFIWLTEVMDEDGLPALMMIVGDAGLAVPYLGQMVRDGTYPATLQIPVRKTA